MNYYLNEYSLTGQYEKIEEFLEDLRRYTLPVLKKIEEEKDSVIWKKDTLWQAEVCKGTQLCQITDKKNERTAEYLNLKSRLIRLYQDGKFWDSTEISDIEIKEYNFDKGTSFKVPNCFSNAILNGGKIVSFIHPNYKDSELSIVVSYTDYDEQCYLNNIYDIKYWNKEPETKVWRDSPKYTIQVRAREYDYHPPHFHVLAKEYAAVFRISDGKLYTSGKSGWPSKLTAEIKQWYEEHKEELQEAWELLHNSGNKWK